MALRRAAHLDTMYQELPLPDRFQAARDDGFDAVELWSWEDRDLAAVRAAADRAGISICCCDGDGPVSLIDPDRREAYLGYLRRSLAAASWASPASPSTPTAWGRTAVCWTPGTTSPTP